MATGQTSPKRGKVIDIPANAPTIGTATDLETGGKVSVAFTAGSTTTGGPVFTYTAISNPGSITGTSTTSPITVSGLTNNTAYTFTVAGTNATGNGPLSAASNSATPQQLTAFRSIQTAVGTGSSGTITLSSIPQDFKHLQLRCNLFVANANQSPYIQFNGDSGSSYSRHAGSGYGTGSATAFTGTASASSDKILCYGFGWGTVTTYPNLLIIDIYNYSATDQYKIASVLSGAQSGVAYNGEVAFASGMWKDTAAITSITLTGVSTFTTDTSVALYGITG